jgi:2-phosphosulfolactate phosphatase
LNKSYFDQSGFNIRCEWGREGLQALLDSSDLIIVVDVLSFSTCVDIATSRNAVIIPYPFNTDGVEAFAFEKNAIVAKKRSSLEGYSLSPKSLLNIDTDFRLVLPSPNGSTVSLAAMGKPVVAGCIRNAMAVAQYASAFSSSAIIPCGERWKDGSLRPAFEDLLGAGAIISGISGTKSPEAQLAQAVFEKFQHELERQIMQCSSGRELTERGYINDVILASSLNVSSTVPELIEGEYRRGFARSGV